jgi:hypothetical protein
VARHERAVTEQGAWLVFEDESGQGLRRPRGRTWGRRGQTPVVTVTGGSNKRVSLAALIGIRAGQRPRLVFRVHAGRSGDKRKGFTEAEYARLLANLVKHDIAQLTALAKTWLRRMQYRPGLIEGFLAGTRLDLTPLGNLRN